MATSVVKTFDLYNTTFYWNGYTVPDFATQLNVAQSYYIAQYSSNPIGSQIDFFAQLAGSDVTNLSFSLSGTTIDSLPLLWGKYWWDEAMYYSNSLVLSAITIQYPSYYQKFSESVGSLYYISYTNNLNNTRTVPYNTIIDNLLPTGISKAIQSFYTVANNIFIANIANIGPTGTDTNPNNGNLIMADTDLNKRIISNSTIQTVINSTYPVLSPFLPFNNIIVGNLMVPYYWSTQIQYEDTTSIGDTTITVDITNTTIGNQVQLTTITLSA